MRSVLFSFLHKIRKITKMGLKMSFRVKVVEIKEKRRIMEAVIDFTVGKIENTIWKEKKYEEENIMCPVFSLCT